MRKNCGAYVELPRNNDLPTYSTKFSPFHTTAEHGEQADEMAKDEEDFRMGLQRNILHLSNVVRANQEELASLREQVQ